MKNFMCVMRTRSKITNWLAKAIYSCKIYVICYITTKEHSNRTCYAMWNKLKTIYEKISSAEIPYKRWCKVVILTVLGIIFGAVALVYVVDPHYRYRLPGFYDTVYYELYATAPRLLRDMEYDTFVLGSSMTRNFFLDDIDAALGGKSVKLAASGATTTDLKKFFDIAREAKGNSLKRVVLSLDIYSMNKSKDEAHYKEFEYLYRDDLAEEYKYFFSRQTYSNMYFLIKRKLRPKKKRQHQADVNRMFSTEYAGMRFGIREVMADAIHNERSHHTQTPAHKTNFAHSLNNCLLPMIAENPQIEFTVYLPPYHIYTYCQSQQFREAEGLIRQRTLVMKELLKYPNVKLYDFQADRKYACDFDLYSDVQHFGSHAARLILADLAADHRRIRTAAEVDANERELRALIKEQMPGYYANIKKYKEQ